MAAQDIPLLVGSIVIPAIVPARLIGVKEIILHERPIPLGCNSHRAIKSLSRLIVGKMDPADWTEGNQAPWIAAQVRKPHAPTLRKFRGSELEPAQLDPLVIVITLVDHNLSFIEDVNSVLVLKITGNCILSIFYSRSLTRTKVSMRYRPSGEPAGMR